MWIICHEGAVWCAASWHPFRGFGLVILLGKWAFRSQQWSHQPSQREMWALELYKTFSPSCYRGFRWAYTGETRSCFHAFWQVLQQTSPNLLSPIYFVATQSSVKPWAISHESTLYISHECTHKAPLLYRQSRLYNLPFLPFGRFLSIFQGHLYGSLQFAFYFLLVLAHHLQSGEQSHLHSGAKSSTLGWLRIRDSTWDHRHMSVKMGQCDRVDTLRLWMTCSYNLLGILGPLDVMLPSMLNLMAWKADKI